MSGNAPGTRKHRKRQRKHLKTLFIQFTQGAYSLLLEIQYRLNRFSGYHQTIIKLPKKMTRK